MLRGIMNQYKHNMILTNDYYYFYERAMNEFEQNEQHQRNIISKLGVMYNHILNVVAISLIIFL